MTPATSRPGMSEAAGGGGYCPIRCMTSGRLTPAASTLINTSPGASSGLGRSAGTRTSGPPGLLISMASTAGHCLLPSHILRMSRPAPRFRTPSRRDSQRSGDEDQDERRAHPDAHRLDGGHVADVAPGGRAVSLDAAARTAI